MSWTEYEKRIAGAKTVTELKVIEQELFGRKSGTLTVAMKELKDLKENERMAKAKELNEAKKSLVTALEDKEKDLAAPSNDALKKDRLDMGLELPGEERGHLHLIPEFIENIKEVFGRMGFDVYDGPEMETEDYNFNLLNIPDDHPARDAQDTFFIKDVDRMVLRTHTSNVQIRYAQNHKPPFRAVFPGKVYRKDSDATHSPMFHQFEGMVIGKDISLSHLKAVLVKGLQELIGREVESRFRPGFFPFTEPSLEMDMMWQGDLSDSREGKWLEMGGCGMVHPNVLKNCKIDPKEWQGFAFGFGVERPLMIKHQIPDLRTFYGSDMRFLRQF